MTLIPNIRPHGQGRDAYLFSEGELDRVLRSHLARLVQVIDEIPDTKVLGADFSGLVAMIEEDTFLEVPELDKSGVSMLEPVETKVDARYLPNRHISDPSRLVLIPATTFTFVVPFVGDKEMFRFRPSKWSMNPPIADVVGGELKLTYTLTKPDSEALRTAFDQEVALIEECLGWISVDITRFNDSLRQTIEQQLSARRDRLKESTDVASAVGIPIRRRNDAPTTYTVPTKRKRIPSARPSEKASKAEPLEPALSDEVYEDILTIMDNMVTVMELSPHAFTTMGEEDLRSHFLVQLNGQFEGDATGETFNYEGKTDVLVKVGGRNVFVGECLIWDGPKSLSAKIDQILGYTSWRDTKVAIVVFSRRKSFSSVVEQISPNVLEHPNTVEEVDVEEETRFRFKIRHRDDPDRHLTLTVLAYDVPTE